MNFVRLLRVFQCLDCQDIFEIICELDEINKQICPNCNGQNTFKKFN